MEAMERSCRARSHRAAGPILAGVVTAAVISAVLLHLLLPPRGSIRLRIGGRRVYLNTYRDSRPPSLVRWRGIDNYSGNRGWPQWGAGALRVERRTYEVSWDTRSFRIREP